jgi:hypothetical protein
MRPKYINGGIAGIWILDLAARFVMHFEITVQYVFRNEKENVLVALIDGYEYYFTWHSFYTLVLGTKIAE